MAYLNNNDNNDNNALTQLKEFAETKDKKINELFERLVSDTEKLEYSEIPMNVKNDILTNVEYIFTRLRFVLADEMRRVDYSLNKIDNDSTIPATFKGFFTRRKTYLGGLNSRLNEIREDLSLVQKTVYYNYKY